MKWTDEEKHELNQMIDIQVNTLYQNYAYVMDKHKDIKGVDNSFMIGFVKQCAKEKDLLETIREKVNNND